jgi:hypothetical protein
MSGRDAFRELFSSSTADSRLLGALRGLASTRRTGLAWAEVDEAGHTEPVEEVLRLAASTDEVAWPARYEDDAWSIVIGRDVDSVYISLDRGPGPASVAAGPVTVGLEPGGEATVTGLDAPPAQVRVRWAGGDVLLIRSP